MSNRNPPEEDWLEACAEADRLDPGWRWEELLARQPDLPPDRDAIQIILAAAAKLPKSCVDWLSSFPTFLVSKMPPNRGLEASFLKELREIAPSINEVRESAIRLADLMPGKAPAAGSPYLFDLSMGRVQHTRTVALALRCHALLAIEDGQLEEALHDVRAMFGAARSGEVPSTLMSALVLFSIQMFAFATVERTLAQGEPSADSLLEMQRDVEAALNYPTLLNAVRGERGPSEDTMKAFAEGNLSDAQMRQLEDLASLHLTGIHFIDRWIDWLLIHRRVINHMASVIRYYTTLTEILKESPDALKTRAKEWKTARCKLGFVAGRLHKGFKQVVPAIQKQRAMLATMLTSLAAERFRRQSGHWPNALQDLVPSYLTEAPTDPYDLKSLRYNQYADRVVIYSIGPNGRDGKGKFLLGPGPDRPGDVGMRLWNVDERRLHAR